MNRLIFASFAALILLGAGCGSKTEKVPQATPTETGRIKYNANPLSRIPPDFPSDIPQYAGAKTISAMTVYGSSTLTQDTKAKPAVVIAWATQQFSTMGANKTNEIDLDRGGKSFDFEKNDIRYRVRVDIAADGTALLTIIREAKQ